ncbi:hypothetical protein [Streptomyces xantholiticus]|uniref:hypothetical protein n=1 Tax=Streptomyces xantholiticus TaxID=68285 RepID=UPI0016772D71|nr:hypothetical protein [Streptomyces xantholiticus]
MMPIVTGCSNGEAKAVPELPGRICWDVFASKDLIPFLPSGDKVTISARPFALAEDLDSTTCSLDIDGRTQFQASARYENFERGIDWSSYKKADPDPIDVGEKGIIWYNGAASYVACEPSKTPSTPGKYIDLHLSTFDPPEDEQPRKALPTLLKQFVAFAQRELKCQ